MCMKVLCVEFVRLVCSTFLACSWSLWLEFVGLLLLWATGGEITQFLCFFLLPNLSMFSGKKKVLAKELNLPDETGHG